ncbi:alpha/beta-type small acid-soluble spore protein [Ruminococcus sp.]|uniref:alpha/beta-type small acid-soluble spore protein n=1 Tax=Ruminococcus sp. TaxID=41978 RepID=UPI00388D2755
MSKNNIVVPEAKDALERFKMEAANEVGVSLKQGYNGDLTSKQAGSIGGQMVKKISPIRTRNFIRENRRAYGHEIDYIFNVYVAVSA